jgi:hypothetical protein
MMIGVQGTGLPALGAGQALLFLPVSREPFLTGGPLQLCFKELESY